MITRVLTLGLIVCAAATQAQKPSLLGNWKEPGGSVLRIESCNSGICLRLVLLSPQSPTTMDIHNPDPAQRKRLLCGLVIGTGFHSDDAITAEGGRLYDPKSGHTYHGLITLQNDELRLRGYIGAPIFGRTEIWQRFTGDIPPCASSGSSN